MRLPVLSSLLVVLAVLCSISEAATPGWQLVSQSWRQRADLAQHIRWLTFNISTPFWPVLTPTMSFTLDTTVRSAYFHDNFTNTGQQDGAKPVIYRGHSIFPFDYPYLITAFQPVPPASEDNPHVWAVTRQAPRQGVFNYSEPLYDFGVWSLVDGSGAVLGAVEYEFVFQLVSADAGVRVEEQ